MGVHGLWKLLDSTGSPVPLEDMSNKVLAVDVSIWLNQILKAMRDADGNRLANAHIIAVYHRLCKLLFYKVKPIFVFDGEVPAIKRRTCSKRRAVKRRAEDLASSHKREKLKLSLQKLAVAHVMGADLPHPVENRSPGPGADSNDMFYLEPETTKQRFSELNDCVDNLQHVPLTKHPHFTAQSQKIDPFSAEFKSLPPEIQHELLLEHIGHTKERAKMAGMGGSRTSAGFSQNQIDDVVARNSLNARLADLRRLLKEGSSSTQEEGGYSVQVVRSGCDSEIVFTKQIHRVQYDVVDTRRNVSVLPRIQTEQTIKHALVDRSEPGKPAKSNNEEMKNLFFGSDNSDKSEHDSENEEDDKEREVKNVFGLSRPHPGSFRNPYLSSNKTKTTGSDIKLKIKAIDFGDVASSSEDDDFQDVENEEKVDDFISEKTEDSVINTVPQETVEFTQKEPVATPEQPKTAGIPEDVADDSIILQGTSEEVEIMPDENNDNTSEVKDDKDLVVEEKVPLENGSSIKPPSPHKGPSCVDLKKIEKDLNSELESVRQQQKKAMAVSDTVNKGLITDVKELLKTFGVPFLDAPGEAEAQCAELCNLSLCDGVITDDSDIFLFGNVRVYKDVFKKDRDMKCFTSRNIEEHLGLSRTDLIAMAQLVGSDYCTGVRGIGCVVALELLSRYTSLESFTSQSEVEPKFRKFDLRGLPREDAVKAYLNPKVNKSDEKFTWEELHVEVMKDFLLQKLGWRGNKVDETLKPVLAAIKDSSSQTSIRSFFSATPKINPSKRVQAAVTNKNGKGRKRKPPKKNVNKTKSRKTNFVCSEEDSESD